MDRDGVYLNVNQVRPIPYLIECFLSCAIILVYPWLTRKKGPRFCTKAVFENRKLKSSWDFVEKEQKYPASTQMRASLI